MEKGEQERHCREVWVCSPHRFHSKQVPVNDFVIRSICAMGSCTSFLNFLRLSFPIYKMGGNNTSISVRL